MRRHSLFPKSLASVVEPLTRPVFKARGLAGTKLLGEWERIVGKELSDHCWPEKISFPPGKKNGGTLTVAVESGFAPHIQHMQPVLLERINTYYGYQAVIKLAMNQRAKPRIKSPAEKPREPALPPGAASAAANVENPELKKALQSLANSLSGK